MVRCYSIQLWWRDCGFPAADDSDAAKITASKLFVLIPSPAICGSRAGDRKLDLARAPANLSAIKALA
ncbi:hypothetical protein PCANC_07578 [Puccinia coronata f. sp. avenae]|uniref:Uncharacterized protein n=1 Tax=Puccinia coronata f. sp. avenae TaxID=200324 RepID=A0A2N5VK74_9BASI|nr:hypothetical protein PCANC_07578 [Puccinia coronata f. sp. avenae]